MNIFVLLSVNLFENQFNEMIREHGQRLLFIELITRQKVVQTIA